MSASSSQLGTVLSIALRSAPRGPMVEIDRAEAVPDAGLRGDIAVSPKRGITFISRSQWDDVRRELNADLPWFIRRANVLIDAPSLADWIGRTIAIGPVRVEILKETKPCELMDFFHQGLRAALEPAFRGGVHGRVRTGGAFRIGDTVRLADPT